MLGTLFKAALNSVIARPGKTITTAGPLMRATSPEVLSTAGKTLRDPNATDREKTIAGSILGQEPKKET